MKRCYRLLTNRDKRIPHQMAAREAGKGMIYEDPSSGSPVAWICLRGFFAIFLHMARPTPVGGLLWFRVGSAGTAGRLYCGDFFWLSGEMRPGLIGHLRQGQNKWPGRTRSRIVKWLPPVTKDFGRLLIS